MSDSMREWGANSAEAINEHNARRKAARAAKHRRPKIEEVLDGLVGDRESLRETLTNTRELLRKVCRYADWAAIKDRVEPWSVIKQITGHGSGISHAIYELYRDDEREVHAGKLSHE